MVNRSKQKSNTSGHVGVSWNYLRKKWYVRIRVEKKNLYIGSFVDKQEAAAAHREALEKYYPGLIQKEL